MGRKPEDIPIAVPADLAPAWGLASDLADRGIVLRINECGECGIAGPYGPSDLMALYARASEMRIFLTWLRAYLRRHWPRLEAAGLRVDAVRWWEET